MKKFISVVLLILFFSSCYYDNVDEMHPEAGLVPDCDPDTTAVTYAKDIQPLIAANCGSGNSCHNATAASLVSLVTYEDDSTYATQNLLCVINHETGCKPMPKDGNKLSDCKINKIAAWIHQGLAR